VDTFELLPTLAQGELSETSAPELVAAAFRSRASGTLWVETQEKVELRVYFRAGDMCGAAPSEGLQTLAHVLLANEWVSALEIESTGEEAKAAQKRHADVLLAKGLLTPEKLRAAVHAQNVSNLASLLAITAGSYDWRGWESPPSWAREMVGPGPAMVAALENPKHEARRKRVLDWLGLSSARLSSDWPDLQDRLGLEAPELRAAEVLNLPRKPSELIDASRLPKARGEALLVTLLLVGAAEAQETKSQPPPPPLQQPRFTPPSQPRAEPARILTPAASPAAAPRPAAARILSQPAMPRVPPKPVVLDDLHDLVLEPLPEEQPLVAPMPAKPVEDDLFPPLELDTSPKAEVVQTRAQRQDDAMAQLDALLVEDPDEPPLELDTKPKPASHGVTANDAPEPLKSTFAQNERQQDASANELRKKMLARGMRNLGNGPSGITPPAGFTSEPLLPETPAAPSAGKMTDDERRFADDALDRLKRAPEQTAYARLGVSQNATQEAIKGAYLMAAKRFHPDRANGGLSSMQGDLQKLFGLLKDAYESISTKEGRERYDQGQRAGGHSAGGPRQASRKDEAAMAVKMGEVLLKKRDFEAAITKLRRAVDLDATGDAIAALAWALVADPKATPATKEEAATLINKALRADGLTARTFYVAGVLWRTKDPDSAVDAFRKALEMDPNHSDAALELRLIEQRRGKQAKAGGGVLSGLLFGKRKG
jgi:tetratricopeptide (TPR) repeat protein